MDLYLPSRSGKFERAQPVLSDDRVLLTQGYMGGRFYEAARRGRVFTGNMAAAGAILPIYSNTAQVFGIWNPAGNKFNAVPIRIGASYVDTTAAASGLVLAVVKDAPAVVAGSSTISAFTATDPENGQIGGGQRATVKFTASAATVTAPTILRHLGWNQGAYAATGTNFLAPNEFTFDGDFYLPPGVAVFLAGNIAQLAKWACSFTWAEEPV